MLAGCASASAKAPLTTAATVAPVVPPAAPIQTVSVTPPPLDPRGHVRKELMERAMTALDVHHHKIPLRDRMYLVDFQKFSGEERLYEVDLVAGEVKVLRTCHGRGSDPSHSGYAQRFSNTPDSNMSSVGAYATAGASWGSQQGPNVLLDGLEYSNDKARERAIILVGKAAYRPLGRSYGCFSVAHTDLPELRERMGEGRLLFAWA